MITGSFFRSSSYGFESWWRRGGIGDREGYVYHVYIKAAKSAGPIYSYRELSEVSGGDREAEARDLKGCGKKGLLKDWTCVAKFYRVLVTEPT